MPKKKSAPPVKTAPCQVCAGEMVYVATIPSAGRLPQLYTFKCRECGCRRTELREETELDEAA